MMTSVRNRRCYMWALLLFLSLAAMRLAFLSADPPEDLSASGGIYFDEGNQCHNARNKVLFGRWSMDEWNDVLYSPVLTMIKYGTFKLFGVGLAQERLVSVGFALASLLVFYLLLLHDFKPATALVGLLIFGVNYLLAMYQRVGLFETPVIFLILLTFYLLSLGTRRLGYLFPAGVAAFSVYVFKNLFLYFLPVPLLCLAVWLAGKRVKERMSWRRVGACMALLLAGYLVLFAAWFLIFYLPNRQWIEHAAGDYMKSLILPHSLSALAQNIRALPWRYYYAWMPITAVLALCAVPMLYRRLLRGGLAMAHLCFFGFFLAHTGFFLGLSYRPLRYFLPVVPSLVWLAVCLLQRISRPPQPQPARGGWRYLPLDSLWLAFALGACFVPLARAYVVNIPAPPLSWPYLVAAVAAVALYRLLARRIPRLPAKTLWIVLLAAGIAVVNLGRYATWVNRRQYQVRDISRDLGRKYTDAYIAGLAAPAFCLENRHKALFLWENFVNYKQPFDNFPLTHAMLAHYNKEIDYYFRKWPNIMGQANLLAVYNLKNIFMHFYAVRQPFVAATAQTEAGLRIEVINPRKHPVACRPGIVFTYALGEKQWRDMDAFSVVRTPGAYELQPGDNSIAVNLANPQPDRPLTRKLLFLDLQQPIGPLRYEAEYLHFHSGNNARVTGASKGRVRRFKQDIDTRAFITFGPFVPLYPGLIIVRPRLRFSNVHDTGKPVAVIDITGKGPGGLTRYTANYIYAKDVIPGRWQEHAFWGMLPAVSWLEFRTFAEGSADMDIDYFDFYHIKGYYLPL